MNGTLSTRRQERGGRCRSGVLRLVAVVAAVLFYSAVPVHARSNRFAVVQFSNGEQLEGTLSLTTGSELKIHDGKQLRTLTLDVLQEMVFEPEQETMEQKWRFPEAGRTRKETWGQPYPVREILAAISLADGTVIRGHVYTTVFYLEGKEQTTKVVLRAKDRGGEGQTFADIVYPVRISFSDPASWLSRVIDIKVGEAGAGELVVLTPGALLRVPATRGTEASTFRLKGLLTTNCFLAVKFPSHIAVGWPATADTGLAARIQQGLGDAEDFFDVQNLLGVYRCGGDVYTLLQLSRKRSTTLDAAASQPWRLEIWRWKDRDDHLMVAGRGYFFRGILAPGVAPPDVSTSEAIWAIGLKDGMELP